MSKQRTYLANLLDKHVIVTTPACRSLDLIKMDGCLVPGTERDWSRLNIATWLRTHRRAGAVKRIA
jgi:hypothetical protein